MDKFQIDVRELALAFEKPLEHIDTWNSLGPATAVDRLARAIEAIGAARDEENRETARLVLGWARDTRSVVHIAEHFGVNPSAISQRKSRIERVLRELGDDEVMGEHPLVRLWKERAASCVRVEDLPHWMSSSLVDGENVEAWPTSQDVFWVLLHAVMRQPRLVTGSDGSRWLIDMALDERGDTKDRLASVLQSLADRLTGSTSQVFGDADLRGELERLGVSPLSIDVVIESLGRMVQRSVAHSGRVLVLSNDDAKNVQGIIKSVMESLDVERSEVARVIAEQQDRNPKSVSNELRRL